MRISVLRKFSTGSQPSTSEPTVRTLYRAPVDPLGRHPRTVTSVPSFRFANGIFPASSVKIAPDSSFPEQVT